MKNGRLPQEEALSEAYEAALKALAAGSSPQETLAEQPDLADTLLPFVETAALAREYALRTVPPGAQQRSRTRMLVHAEKLRSGKSSRFGWPFFRRLTMQALAVLLVLAASLTGLAAASAQTIPGDQLYGIKRTVEDVRLNLSQPQARGSLERVYRERRLDEIRRVIDDGRQIAVDFEGVVNRAEGTSWEIAGLTVLLDNETSILGEILPGMLVRVTGQTTPEGSILARSIRVIAYAFTGPLESLAGEVWVIAGVPVLITADSQIAPGVALGVPVVVLAQVSETGTISARAVLLADVLDGGGEPQGTAEPGGSVSPAGAPSATPTATVTATASATATPTPSRTLVPATPDDDHETESPEPTEEEEEDHSGSGSGGETETPEPTKTDKPDDD